MRIWTRRGLMFASASSGVQGFTAENDPGGEQQQRRIDGSIQTGQRTVHPGHSAMIVNQKIANVIPFEMRNEEIDRVNHGAQRFGLLQRYLVEVPAQQQNSD